MISYVRLRKKITLDMGNPGKGERNVYLHAPNIPHPSARGHRPIAWDMWLITFSCHLLPLSYYYIQPLNYSTHV
jgi:hypothetical protein